MKRFIFILFLLPALLFGQRVELFNGDVIKTDEISMKGDTIFLSDTLFFRDMVKSIIFSEGELKTEKRGIPQDILKIIKEREGLIAKYRDFPGVVLLDKGTNRLHPDGTRTYRYHFRGLILKDSKRHWATFQRRFRPAMEKTTIKMAQVIKPDGKVIPLDMSMVKITKPRRGKVFFGKGKVISFALPGVEVGDIVEYLYEKDIFNPWSKEIFAFNWFFGGSDPVSNSTIDIIIPGDKNLYFVLKNAESVAIDSIITDSIKTYSFKVENTIPPIGEPLMPAAGKILPSLYISTLKDWDYIFKWYSDFQKKRMEVTQEIQGLADSIVGDAETEEEKTASLYHWVQRNIRYISIKGGASSGVSGHKASVTLENGYGDCTDKAILFSTLLKAVGVEAYPVYLHTHPSPGLLKEIPSFWGNHAIVEVFPQHRKPYILDPVSEHSRYPSFAQMDHGVYAICAQKSRIDLIEVPPPERNKRNYQYEMVFSSDGDATIKFQSNYTGSYESGIRAYWESLKPDERKKQFQEMAKRTSPTAELIDYSLENLTDISKPLRMKIIYKVSDLLEKAGDLYLLALPEIIDRHKRRELSLSKRKYDLVYDTSEEIVHTFHIILPEDMIVEATPEPIHIQKKFIEYRAGYEMKDNTLIFKDDWKRKGRIIPQENYSEYKGISLEVSRFVKKPIIFRKTGGAR
ncbi:DUF3857 domain-containing transglutaminase family protein [candidate division WOR-3 bacterium]|nr:DUF3857 domain-containing transglutaminase family protein [candidate division WOR-3 bacterium]